MKAKRVLDKLELLKNIKPGKKVEAKKPKKKKEEKVIDADVNGDGKVDEKDVEEVKKKIVKKKD